MTTKSYMPWPDDNQPASFEKIADAVCDAIKFAYKLKRKNLDLDIPWKGPNIGKSERGTCLQPHEQLTAEYLNWVEQEQDRDALDEVVGLALRLGIEQGRRIEYNRRL